MNTSGSVKTFEIESKWLIDREKRLNASSFSPESAKSLNLINNLRKKGITVDNIENYVDDIFYPNRFKRHYSKEGVEFFSSKDIFDFAPIGKRITNVSEKYFIKPNWILITRSGTVGRVLLSNKFLAKATISEHVIRTIPKEDAPVGYLYTYLLSNIGQSLLMRNVFGGVVNEIEPKHIAKIPIPILPRIIDKINNKIHEAQKLREEAQSLIPIIKKLLREKLNLPNIDENNGNIKTFNVKKSELCLRLDGRYHLPIHSNITKILKKSDASVLMLKELTQGIFEVPPFKHIYVDQENGIPFYTSAEILYHRLIPSKFLLETSVDIQTYKIKKGWLLMARSGDPEAGVMGKIRLTLDDLNNVTTSDHVLRIIPDTKKINPGYLGAFLSDNIYGKKQLLRGSFGKNVPAVRPQHIENVLVPLPEMSIQKEIGEIFELMFKKFDDSNQMEISAVNMLEKELRRTAEN